MTAVILGSSWQFPIVIDDDDTPMQNEAPIAGSSWEFPIIIDADYFEEPMPSSSHPAVFNGGNTPVKTEDEDNGVEQTDSLSRRDTEQEPDGIPGPSSYRPATSNSDSTLSEPGEGQNGGEQTNSPLASGTGQDADGIPGPSSYRPAATNSDNPPSETGNEQNGGEQILDPLRRGTGQVFARVFVPPTANSDPRLVFPARSGGDLLVSSQDEAQFLLYTSGASVAPGKANARAGWAVIYNRGNGGNTGQGQHYYGRFEDRGPFGSEERPSTQAASLRAVLAALRCRRWDPSRFNSLVIALTDNTVFRGATEWIMQWVNNGWRRADRQRVRNSDLWQCVQGEIERLAERGIQVCFWKLTNMEYCTARMYAKAGARCAPVPQFTEDYR